VLLGPIPAEMLGLTAPHSWMESARILGILFGAIAISIAIFRRRGEWQFRQLQKMVGSMLPISPPEQLWFASSDSVQESPRNFYIAVSSSGTCGHLFQG